jgi:tripartite-type tricarboxylate transporter receptor subunit TctC
MFAFTRTTFRRSIDCVVSCGCLVALALTAQIAVAQTWPTQPIRLMTAFPAGSTADFIARLISDDLSRALGQPVIVDHKPGAGGNIGTDFVAKSKPDGYTILLSTNTPLTTAAKLYKSLPFDPDKDFAPVTMVAVTPQMIVASPQSGIENVGQLLAMARANPGNLNYGSVGNGSASHLLMELLKSSAGLDIVHIPFSGSPPLITALLGGHIQIGSVAPAAAMQHVRAGKLRALAVTTLERSPALPDIPTMAESGFPGFEAAGWQAIVVPAKTPKPIIDRLNREIVQILSQAEVKQKMLTQFFIAAPGTPEAVTERMRVDRLKWGRIIDMVGATVD